MDSLMAIEGFQCDLPTFGIEGGQFFTHFQYTGLIGADTNITNAKTRDVGSIGRLPLVGLGSPRQSDSS